MNRIRINGEVTKKYEQIIELSDEELQKFRNDLSIEETKGDQAIDDFLGENFADTHPLDWQYDSWSADLIDDKGSIIEDII